MSKNKVYDYIIVGQGIAGTLLSWFLKKRGKSFYFIDNDHHQAASNIAAGVINPITGRKYVKSWRIEQFLPFADQTYTEISKFLTSQVAHKKNIFRGLYSIRDENTWEARKSDEIAGQYIVEQPDAKEYEGKINGIFSYGELKGGMQVQLPVIIEKYRAQLIADQLILNEKFDFHQLIISNDKVSYKNLDARHIIFAEGYQSQFNPYFNYLPFEPAKGDVLIIKIEGHPFDNILRHKVFIAPIDDVHYWVGSDYRWKFEDDKPNLAKKNELIEILDKILNVPYEVVSHIAGIRPCVKSRRPFLGRHPEKSIISIFNGLGTKGASLGPYWANHLINHLEDSSELDKDVNINRFQKS